MPAALAIFAACDRASARRSWSLQSPPEFSPPATENDKVYFFPVSNVFCCAVKSAMVDFKAVSGAVSEKLQEIEPPPDAYRPVKLDTVTPAPAKAATTSSRVALN